MSGTDPPTAPCRRILAAGPALRGCGLALLLCACASGAGGEGGGTQTYPPQTWSHVEDRLEFPGLHSQGLASLPALGPDDFAYTSRYTIDRTSGGEIAVARFALPASVLALRFDHVGDPDAHGPLVWAGLEDNAEPRAESYHRGFIAYDAETLLPAGWSHDTGSPEVAADGDAPWVAVSPDGLWIATGAWSPMDSLYLYPTRDAAPATGGEIGGVTVVPVENAFRAPQGCDFDGPSLLVCASDDEEMGRMAYAVYLSAPIRGERLPEGITARAEALFPTAAPPPLCDEPVEVEGIDVEGDALRILVIGTCLVDSHLYRYER